MNPTQVEKVFLSISGVMLVTFLLALFYASFGLGMHLPDREGEISPSEVRATPPFNEPGVHEVAPGEFEVVVIGMAWAFEPREIRVPAGAPVTFFTATTDVIHGFHIEGTRVNLMMIPGQIGRFEYVFREPGEHLIICHEYCGVGHHLMYGRVIVEDPETFRSRNAGGDA